MVKEQIIKKRKELKKLQEQNRNNKRNYIIINEMQKGNFFGEIGAISDLRRTSSVLAINPMLLGKIPIHLLREFMIQNSNFHKKIRKHASLYKD